MADTSQLREYIAPEGTKLMSDALYDVAVERWRQVEEEGFLPEDDDLVFSGTLSRMGACYATHVSDFFDRDELTRETLNEYQQAPFSEDWPGARCPWKPSFPRHDLVKAAALILAEIERIDRRGQYQ